MVMARYGNGLSQTHQARILDAEQANRPLDKALHRFWWNRIRIESQVRVDRSSIR